MKSQLWQRIRAARKFADLRQQDIAGPCGVGRSTVALWESKMEENRTKPDLDQLKTLAKLTGLPLDKTIISWVREGSTQADDFTEEAFEVFDVMTYRVRTPAEAASLILGNS